MPHIVETAYAKINLALHVRRRRDDGYHELETLFAFADNGDELSVEPSSDFSLKIIGPFSKGLSSGPDNLVLRAAMQLAARHGITAGAAFILDKRLPIASGIGGGSADAAAALRLAIKLWGLDPEHEELASLALELGADVPACIASQSCFGTGVGDQLSPVKGAALSHMPILLVNPLIPCPTGAVFKAWDGKDRGALDPADWMQARNDLELPSINLHPEIADVLSALNENSPKLARMSGSGATCFGIFDSIAHRDAACAMIQTKHPDWWTMMAALR